MSTSSTTPRTPLSTLLSPPPALQSRLDDLESKRARYEALSRRLFTLPNRLRRPGLIPVGPRLYLPGEVVETNNVTVLLGACGDEAYFAERSAFQARGIVQRRLAAIDHKVRHIVATNVAQENVAPSVKEGCSPDVTEEGAGEGDTLLFAEERLVDKLDVVAPVPPQNPPLLSVSETSSRELQSLSKEAVSVKASPSIVDIARLQVEHAKDGKFGKQAREAPQLDMIERGVHAAELEPRVQVDGSKGHLHKLKKSVSFRDPVVTDVGWAASCANSRKPVKRKSPLAAMLAAARAAHAKEMMTGENVLEDSDEEEDSEAADGGTRKRGDSEEAEKVQSRFDEAVKNAERQVVEDGIVNVMEVYEGEGEEPSRVEMPKGFLLDSNVSFDEGSEEYLDVTGNNDNTMEGSGNMLKDNATRDEYLQALLEVEREAELEEKRKEAKKSAKVLRKEEKEFGTGFNKGFFGTPSTKKTSKSLPSERKKTEEEVVLTGAKPSGEERVIERVVERRPSKKGGKRNRKPRSSSMPEPRGMTVMQLEKGVERDMEFIDTRDESSEAERPAVSKFRQLRNLQKYENSSA